MIKITEKSFESNCIFGWLNVNLGLTLTGYDYIAYETNQQNKVVWACAIVKGMHEVFIDHYSTGPGWFSRSLADKLFKFCFSLAPRITCHVSAKNIDSINFMYRLGFIEEGIMRQNFDGTTDTIIFGLLVSDWENSPFFKND